MAGLPFNKEVRAKVMTMFSADFPPWQASLSHRDKGNSHNHLLCPLFGKGRRKNLVANPFFFFFKKTLAFPLLK